MTKKDDRITQIAEEWRSYCERLPGYRPHTQEEMAGIVLRWRERSERQLKESRLRPPGRRRKRPPGNDQGGNGP